MSSYRKPSSSGHRAGDGEFLWLVSLSDLMILLFVFFVVLFSFSFKKLGAVEFQKITSSFRAPGSEVAPIDAIQAKLLRWVIEKKLLQDVQVEQKEDALIINIREKVLFAAGAWELSDEGTELARRLGEALVKIPAPYRIGVEGHTDDEPVAGRGTIRDNWELSALRARSVLKALHLGPEALSRSVILAYGEMRPLVPNRDDKGNPIVENQAKNRRVTLRVF